MCGQEEILSCPEDVSRYLVFLEKSQKAKNAQVNFKNIQARKFYKDNKEMFDKFFRLAEKYKIDMKDYVKFFVEELSKKKKDAKRDFLCMNTMNKYVEHLQIRFQYQKIYKNILKSVDNIVEECLKGGYSDARDYLKFLIRENRLAEKVFSGKISQYYLSTIKNIDKIIDGMDSISKDELKVISERKTKLRADAQNAFLFMKSQQMSPIKLTNEKLIEKLNQKQNN